VLNHTATRFESARKSGGGKIVQQCGFTGPWPAGDNDEPVGVIGGHRTVRSVESQRMYNNVYIFLCSFSLPLNSKNTATTPATQQHTGVRVHSVRFTPHRAPHAVPVGLVA